MNIYKEDIECIGDYKEKNLEDNLDMFATYPGTKRRILLQNQFAV